MFQARTGTVGVFVDLDLPALGFVDVLGLPMNPDEWPAVGRTTKFEVLQHDVGQIRLRPLDPALRRSSSAKRYSGQKWDEIKRRYPVGSLVELTVVQFFMSNWGCAVSDGFLDEVVEWSGEAPAEGTPQRCRVERHLDSSQRVVLVSPESNAL